MTIQNAEDDPVSSVQQTGVPVETVVALHPSVKMIPQAVAEVVQTELMLNTIQGKFTIFDPQSGFQFLG